MQIRKRHKSRTQSDSFTGHVVWYTEQQFFGSPPPPVQCPPPPHTHTHVHIHRQKWEQAKQSELNTGIRKSGCRERQSNTGTVVRTLSAKPQIVYEEEHRYSGPLVFTHSEPRELDVSLKDKENPKMLPDKQLHYWEKVLDVNLAVRVSLNFAPDFI